MNHNFYIVEQATILITCNKLLLLLLLLLLL